MEARARLYDARASADPKAILEAAEAARDPVLWHLAARYLRFEVVDVEMAARAAEAAVRSSGALSRPARDMLASVRNRQRRPDDALRLLDPHGRVPTKRPSAGFWYEAVYAEAHLLLGEDAAARHALERAAQDRRVLPYLRPDPAFAALADVFADADERFFYDEMFARDPGE